MKNLIDRTLNAFLCGLMIAVVVAGCMAPKPTSSLIAATLQGQGNRAPAVLK